MPDDVGESSLPLGRWAEQVPPASLGTKTGRDRFIITIKLAERLPKTVTRFIEDLNDALRAAAARSRDEAARPDFELIDADRARLQRATASFDTFKGAKSCLELLKELGLKVNDISPELEQFGTKKYDPWFERMSQAWWPWLAAWRDPPPELPMMKVTNRLNLTEGSKYAVGADGKLGKSDAEGRRTPEEPPREEPEPAREDEEPPQEERREPRKKKKKKRE